MNLYTIAIDNLIRRKGKTAFLVIGIVIGITATVGLLLITQAMRQDFQDKISKFGANIIITPQKDELPLTYGSVTMPVLKLNDKAGIDQSDVKKLRSIRGLGALSAKVVGGTTINGKNGLLVGVVFSHEKALKNWWEITGRIPRDADEALIGSSLAANLGLKTGSRAKIGGADFNVAGVIKETGASDDNAIFLSLPRAQKILGLQNKLSLIEAGAANGTGSAPDVAKRISSRFPTLQAAAIEEAMQAQSANIKFFSWFSLVSSAVILFVSSLIVFITMMSSVNERIREIGIFRAVGFRQKHVMTIIMTEAAAVSFAGGLAGALAGYGLARIALPFFVKDIRHVPFGPLVLVLAITLAIAIGCLSSWLPANRAAKMDPAQALRFI